MPPAGADSMTLFPLQKLNGPPAVIVAVGNGFTTTTVLLVLEQLGPGLELAARLPDHAGLCRVVCQSL